METKKGKTVFVEYSTADKGQHFMTVVQNKDHHRIIIGRIYKEYDKENKKYEYFATDFANNQVFADYKDLHAIKKQFIEHGDNLAYAVPVNPNRPRHSERLISPQRDERATDLKGIRDKKSSKEKAKEVPRQNPDTKINEDQKEKEQDLKNTEKYTDTEQIQEDQEQDIASERMEELEELRDQGDDREQEMEIEM
ncbi:MAG: hypothetical protein EHM93_06780 [Bacteroidales bacterium]|nr:MAG: hypothetical protein EHM93_06780 [Bacteroidales bacterium]